MHLMLLAAGVLAVAAGVIGLLFGAANHAPGVGNTLILVGAVAVVGGAVLVGLAAVLSRLRRIHDTLESQMVPRAIVPASGVEPAGAPVVVAAAPPHPPRSERNLAPSVEPARDPRSPFPGAEPSGRGGEAAPSPAVSVQPPRRGAEADLAGAPPRADWPRPEVRPPPPVLEAAAPAQTITVRNDRTLVPERGVRDEAGTPPGVQASASAPPAAGEEPAAAASASLGFGTPGSPAILKSGVVEGMAYTLYDDGSIEAEMPDGTMRFSSIAELRTHLRDRAQSAG